MGKSKRSKISLLFAGAAVACLAIATLGFYAVSLVPFPCALLLMVLFFVFVWAAVKISPGIGLHKDTSLQGTSKTLVVLHAGSQGEAQQFIQVKQRSAGS